MDLKSGTPLWSAFNPPTPELTPLTEDVTCDVVVLGAGITGAFVASLLGEAGCNVVVIDRRGIARGSTPASTALIQYEIDTPLVELAELVGPDDARAAYRACRRCLDELIAVAARFNVDCDLSWRSSLFLAAQPEHVPWMRDEVRARQNIGIEVGFIEGESLLHRFDLRRPAGILSAAAIELDPLKLTRGLLNAACRAGVRCFQSEISPSEVQDGVRHLTTDSGHTLRTKHLVIATGYETPEQFSSVNKYCKLTSTFALASQKFAGGPCWPEGPLLWDSAEPYFYARHTADHRIIVGGEDEPFSDPDLRDALLPRKTEALLKKASQILPHLQLSAAYAWAGTFGKSIDGLPLIGGLPQYPGCHFALGYGGNGITFALMAAEIIRDRILGRQNDLGRVFGFDRRSAWSGS